MNTQSDHRRLQIETPQIATSWSAHRISRTIYLPQTLFLISVFVAILLLIPEANIGTPGLLVTVLSPLVCPHQAFQHTKDALLVTHRRMAV